MSTASLGGSKIFGEVRVNLKITFPTLDNEALEVRAKPHKLLSQVILHVLQKLQGIFHLSNTRIASYITVGIIIDELDVRDADSNESIHLDTIVSTMKTNAITVQKVSANKIYIEPVRGLPIWLWTTMGRSMMARGQMLKAMKNNLEKYNF